MQWNRQRQQKRERGGKEREKAVILKEARGDNTTWPVLRFMCRICPILSYLTLEQLLLLLLLYC